ncbi:hypothetical protein PTMSG1_06870 [Pyrenophora teres f. maculata]|nr:hypothetical protein PTMSG1_06870 [Pyrenophora teres f. maculata]
MLPSCCKLLSDDYTLSCHSGAETKLDSDDMTTSMSRKARSQCIQQRTEEDDGTATKPDPTLSQALPAFPDITHDEEDPEFQAEARTPSSSSPKAPVVVLDNDGDKKVVDPSRRSAQESIEHAKYWALPERPDDEGGYRQSRQHLKIRYKHAQIPVVEILRNSMAKIDMLPLGSIGTERVTKSRPQYTCDAGQWAKDEDTLTRLTRLARAYSPAGGFSIAQASASII